MKTGKREFLTSGLEAGVKQIAKEKTWLFVSIVERIWGRARHDQK
jgi:hypothetical protein